MASTSPLARQLRGRSPMAETAFPVVIEVPKGSKNKYRAR